MLYSNRRSACSTVPVVRSRRAAATGRGGLAKEGAHVREGDLFADIVEAGEMEDTFEVTHIPLS